MTKDEQAEFRTSILAALGEPADSEIDIVERIAELKKAIEVKNRALHTLRVRCGIDNEDGSPNLANTVKVSPQPVGEWKKSDNGNYPVMSWSKDYALKIGDKLYLRPPRTPEPPQQEAQPVAWWNGLTHAESSTGPWPSFNVVESEGISIPLYLHPPQIPEPISEAVKLAAERCKEILGTSDMYPSIRCLIEFADAAIEREVKGEVK